VISCQHVPVSHNASLTNCLEVNFLEATLPVYKYYRSPNGDGSRTTEMRATLEPFHVGLSANMSLKDSASVVNVKRYGCRAKLVVATSFEIDNSCTFSHDYRKNLAQKFQTMDIHNSRKNQLYR
jgi:hypothetical protein